jgi:hypothetical protein
MDNGYHPDYARDDNYENEKPDQPHYTHQHHYQKIQV